MNLFNDLWLSDTTDYLICMSCWMFWMSAFGVTQFVFFSILLSKYYYIALLYLIYMYLDIDAPKKGGKLQQWIRQMAAWDYVLKYFPVYFHKTSDLDSNKNYIIGCHPHGLMVYGTALSYQIYEKHFKKVFPGITVRVCAHSMLFWIPLYRDILLAFGACSTDKESIEYIISKMGTGNAAAIVLGGAKEIFQTTPYKMKLKLKDRKGFVKLALKHGASLVPSICFGENEFFADSETNFPFVFKLLQKWSETGSIQQILAVGPYFTLYGIFNFKTIISKFSGSERHRHHFHTIIGKPINVVKNDNPSNEEIDQLHKKYLQNLCDLFYENREKYSSNRNCEIVIF